MPYSRRVYYKISWLRGKSMAEFADTVIDIKENALLFATPKIPYHWLPPTLTRPGCSAYLHPISCCLESQA